MKKQNVRTLSLIVCTFTYLLVGAAVFDSLESDNETKQREIVKRLRKKLTLKYNISASDYKVIESVITKSIPHRAGYQWKFSGAFYFATTVITTIGYGHSTPTTIGGKTFCMFYAIAGIPLGLVMFQSIGERLNTCVAFILRNLKRCAKITSSDVVQTHLIGVASFLGTMVILVGAYAFHNYEHWSYFDSLYYCFITVTTIGFGDFVALQKNGHLQNNPQYVAFSLIFILFGLTVVSAAMNLLVLRFLTMNTEDERRDEQEAQLAAQGLVRLEGDIITANGSIALDGSETVDPSFVQGPSNAQPDDVSVCSCSCYGLPKYRSRRRSSDETYYQSGEPFLDSITRPSRYVVRQPPGRVSHLLPVISTIGSPTSGVSHVYDSTDFLQEDPPTTTNIMILDSPDEYVTEDHDEQQTLRRLSI